MNKKMKLLSRAVAMLLCLTMLLSMTAFATGETYYLNDLQVSSDGSVEKDETFGLRMTVVDPAIKALKGAVGPDGSPAPDGLAAENISVQLANNAFTLSGAPTVEALDLVNGTYTLVFTGVKYNGGDNVFAISVAYQGTTLPRIQLSEAIHVCVPYVAPTPAPTAEPQEEKPAPTSSSAYLVAYALTNAAGGEVVRVEKGDRVNVVLSVTDPAIVGTSLKAEHIAARVNTATFTYTGLGEASKVDTNTGSYVLLFRDVIFNGGDNSFSVDISYVGSALAQGTITKSFGQCVVNTEENSRTPSILVRGNSIVSAAEGCPAGSAMAGSECTLTLELLTTSGDESLTDLLVTVALPEGVTLASGNSTAYIASMAAGGTGSVSFQLLPSATYTGGVATVGVSLSAVGKDTGAPISSSTSVTVPVIQPERFELTNLEAPEMMYLGEEGYVSLIFVNKGKSAINNLSAEIRGENLANPGQSQYLGNIAAGTENSVDFSIMAEQSGPMTVTILLTYEDAQGQLKTKEKQFSCDVQEMPVFEDPMIYDPMMGMEPMEEEEAGLPVWAKVLIAAAVVGGVAAAVILTKKRKAAALQQLEDEDEDI